MLWAVKFPLLTNLFSDMAAPLFRGISTLCYRLMRQIFRRETCSLGVFHECFQENF